MPQIYDLQALYTAHQFVHPVKIGSESEVQAARCASLFSSYNGRKLYTKLCENAGASSSKS